MNECLLNEFHPHLIICSKGLPEKQKLTDCSTEIFLNSCGGKMPDKLSQTT